MFVRIRTMLIIFSTMLLIVSFSVLVGIITIRSGIDASQEADLMLLSDIADQYISSEIIALKQKAAMESLVLSMVDEEFWQDAFIDMLMRNNEFIGIAVFNDRHELISSMGESVASHEALSDRHIQRAFQGRVSISTTIPTEDGLFVYLSARLHGSNDRILIFTLPGMYLTQVVSSLVIWETGHVFVDDSEGHIIANIRREWVEDRVNFMKIAETDPEYAVRGDIVRRGIAGESGIGHFSVSDIPRICAFRPISGSEEGWFLGLIAPVHESPFRGIDLGLIVVGVVSLFLSLITAIIASGFIKKPFDQIAALKEEAEANSKFKSDFLAAMSHEMRTPLTAVLGLTELTLETVQLDDETHANLIKVYRAGETLLSLINDILDISKIEADKLELNPKEYDVPSLLNDTITQCVLYKGEKPIELILNIGEDLPNYLYGDELRIKQILNNLLSNAFKFTNEGTVELGMRCEQDEQNKEQLWLTAWVRDTGIGIKNENMEKLFNLYSQLEESSRSGSGSLSDRRTVGTGLGLTISRRAAQMMDGTITVESEYGKGSVFTVRLKQKYVNDSVIGSDVVESIKRYDYSILKFGNVKMTRINLSYAHILIVDDNPTNLDVAKGLMGIYGMKIDCMTSGYEAIEAIRSEKVKYNAIFMDHMMPEMDGIEAVRIIREEIGTEYARTVPIIALTANAIVGNEEMFLNKGFEAFISKPIDLVRLDTVLRQWVRDKKAEALLPSKVITVGTGNKNERQILLDDIEGLDIDRGIAHFSFSEEAYINVLGSYVKNTKPLLDLLMNYEGDKLDKYAVTVHGIKGSSRGILATKAGDYAEALEKAAIAGNLDYINANNQIFLDTVLKLLSDIENLIQTNVRDDKPLKDLPDELLLAKLLSSCENYDIDEIDAALSELEKFKYSKDDGLVVWLRENVDQGKYANVIEKLSLTVNKQHPI